jgi:hypothetical protein
MALTTYAELQASVADWLHRGDLTTQIVDGIYLTELAVQKALRNHPGETRSYGSTGSITAFADAGGGEVTVTSNGHGLVTGDVVTISLTTSYNGTFTVTLVDVNNYKITDTFVADDATGTWKSSLRMRAGQDYIPVPSALVELIHLRIDGTDPIRYCRVVSLKELTTIREENASGIPEGICLFGDQILVAPTPNSTYAYTLFYRADVQNLKDGAGGASTWLLDDAPDLLLYGTLAAMKKWVEDDAGMATYSEIFTNLLLQFKRQQWRKRAGGGELACRPDFEVP